MTTCSISMIETAKGASVSKSACVMPGVSIPDKRMRPVNASFCTEPCVDIGSDYREIRYHGA